MNILDKQFDRTALDFFDAEPEVRERIETAWHGRESMTVRDAMLAIGLADKCLCWLTKLGAPPDVVALCTAEAFAGICSDDNNSLSLALREYVERPDRDRANRIIWAASEMRISAAPDWLKGWAMVTALVCFRPNIWLPKEQGGAEQTVGKPDDYDGLQRTGTVRIIRKLEEVGNYGA
jgi:hypothetical protein